MPFTSKNNIGSGGGLTAAQSTALMANTADVATLNADAAIQDNLISLNATKAEVALIKADNDAQDPYTVFVREDDGSIAWTRESGATGVIAAPTFSNTNDFVLDWVEVTEANTQLEWGKRYICLLYTSPSPRD